MTKAERAELRSLLKQRFKVLRRDVDARGTELLTELDERIAAKYAAEDKAWTDAMFLIEEAAREANRAANDALRTLTVDGYDPRREYVIVSARQIGRPQSGERAELRNKGTAAIHRKIREAQLTLDRQENDLLTRLAIGALESDEARGFLGQIPTVSALVPADRLLELEQSLKGELP